MNCKKQMNCKKNGIEISFNSPTDYFLRIYRGDLFQCSKCGHQVISGLGTSYDRKKERCNIDDIIFLNQ